ncbi:MAG: hypothetical protein ACLQD8_04805 [Thermoplasmata archaeon]
MRGADPYRPSLGFDAFGAAVGLSVISGALAIVVPFLAVLTGTLAALSVASWAASRYGTPVGRHLFRHRFGGWAALAVGGTAALYLDPPVPFAPFRSLGLALALVLLWREERPGRRSIRSEGS